jgi:hypothetical protein
VDQNDEKSSNLVTLVAVGVVKLFSGRLDIWGLKKINWFPNKIHW